MGSGVLSKADMEQLIRRYYDGCNEGDANKIAACFTPDAAHYFPPGMPQGPFRGAAKIAERWCHAVQRFGAWWTIDSLLVDPVKGEGVLEWSNFTSKPNAVVRGTEWIAFDRDSGLIREIRAYYPAAIPAGLTRFELEGFDYAGRGYPMVSPRPGSATD